MAESEIHELCPDGDVLFLVKAPDHGLLEDDEWIDRVGPDSYILEEKSANDEVPEETNEDDAASSESAEEPSETSDNVVMRIRASSVHLKLASSYFKAMLSSDRWAEGKSLAANSYIELEIKDWDPEAFLTVMKVIHGRMSQVKRTLNLGPLARIAVIVDFYGFREAFSVISDVWTQNYLFESGIRNEGEMIVWMLVARAFSQTEMLSNIVVDAVLHSTKGLQSLGLGIPETVIDKIAEKRSEVIKTLFEGLHSHFPRLCSRGKFCSYGCDSRALAALTRELWQADFLFDRPEAPFEGLNVADMMEAIKKFRLPRCIGRKDCSSCSNKEVGHTHFCELRPMLDDMTSSLKKDVIRWSDSVWGEEPSPS